MEGALRPRRLALVAVLGGVALATAAGLVGWAWTRVFPHPDYRDPSSPIWGGILVGMVLGPGLAAFLAHRHRGLRTALPVAGLVHVLWGLVLWGGFGLAAALGRFLPEDSTGWIFVGVLVAWILCSMAIGAGAAGALRNWAASSPPDLRGGRLRRLLWWSVTVASVGGAALFLYLFVGYAVMVVGQLANELIR